MRTSQSTSGFTLIELMVVIAIIVVLAALLFPVLSAVRQKSRENVCMSNLHQLGIALKAYAADVHGYPPAPTYDPGNATATPPILPQYYGGFSALYPTYITDKSLLICPDDFAEQKVDADARARVYSSYNGVVDWNNADATQMWDFVTTTAGNVTGPERLYNYYGYTPDPTTTPPGQCNGFDLYAAGNYPSPGNLDPTSSTNSNYVLPTWLSSESLTWRFYPHLINRYAPDTTIVTHCILHRSNYGIYPSTDPTQASRWMDIVLRLDGSTSRVLVQPMSTPDSATTSDTYGVAPFVYQR
jgi:prepilin-type N-terminal cleavage/methylation domain-containing protein